MVQAISQAQGAVVAAIRGEPELAALQVVDAPGRSTVVPYLVVARHDAFSRDADDAPGWEHRLVLHLWHGAASRRQALDLAAGVFETVLGAPLDSEPLRITTRAHLRTETSIDRRTGQALVAMTFKLLSEPAL